MSNTRRSRVELAKEGDEILKHAHCDTVTGGKKDRTYRRNKRAESKSRARRWRAKQKTLGTFGRASPGRRIEVEKA
jgi:hypothetical protein